ncbi:carboxypeptidase regulatory-like domain-containing protein [Methylocystis heyeri]|uniref:Carboxypeptidase regulatory-like domain-containing protein n=1 Tax=Methylocystis heyeri TaxID=391905 RepID=A0A6B8KIX2_9HYPH|nr:carboxypeptidase regulatory-like domain-containing protein [Methylocystis heyeri]QGM47439.1 carboxypeptidase regulatory-like domain-containing protein [Methylocystis heyeri]
MRRALACVFVSALLAGCNQSSPHLDSAAFNPAEAAFIRVPGTASIAGQAFLTDAGETRYAAGEVVRLIPASSYAQARIAHFYGASKFVAADAMPKSTPDPEYVAYTRATKAGAEGRFSFDHVAPGRYFLTTQIIWKPKGAAQSQGGGAFYQAVTVPAGEAGVVNVSLTGN